MRKFIYSILLLSLLGLTGCNEIILETVDNMTYDWINKADDKIVDIELNGSNKEQDNVVKENNINLVKEAPSTFNSKIEQTAYIVDSLYNLQNTNVLFSPLSLDAALGMANLGADGETKLAIDNYLMNDNYHSYMKEYMKNNNYYYESKSDFDVNSIYKVSNSVWLKKDFDWNKEYLENVENYYNAKVEEVDFSDASKVVNDINNWVDESTYGMIDKILKESDITKDSRMILTNAIYFEDAWVENWGEARNQYKFNNLNGTTSSPTIIANSYTRENYYENDKAVAFSASYAKGFKFVGILPKEEGNFTLQDLDIDGLLSTASKNYDIDVFMPEFKYDFKENLTGLLQKMYPKMFINPNFSKMTLAEGLEMNQIYQVATIDLNKYGTKASAATYIMMTCATALPQQRETKEIIIDRPFAYLILDKNDNIVFMGKIVDLN